MSKLKKVLIGEIGVDSGQLMVVDPCYLSRWKDNDFDYQRVYTHTDGTILKYGVDFNNYEEIIGKCGRTMNEMIMSNSVKEITAVDDNSMSYNGACRTTLIHKYGILEDGGAAVFGSGYGDGCYLVYAHINDEGRVMKVTIDMR